MNRNANIKKISGMGVMLALTIVLQIISTNIKFGPVEIALGLIPMILGACIYGPLAGLFLGSALGLVIMLSPATLTFFMPINPVATILLCLLKTGIAGFVSGWIYRLVKTNNSFINVGFASVISPIVNTGLYIIGVILFFMEVYGDITGLLTTTLLINFLIELAVVSLLVVAFERILKIYGKKFLPEE